jgi:hypothetical protein
VIYLDGERIPVVMKRFDIHWCALAVEAEWPERDKYIEVLWWQASIGTLGINQHLLYIGKHEQK